MTQRSEASVKRNGKASSGKKAQSAPYVEVADDAGESGSQDAASLKVEIAGHTHATKAPWESDELLAAVFHSTTVGVAVLTPDAWFVQVNEAFCRIVGYPRDELVAHLDGAALIHSDDLPAMNTQLEALLAERIPVFVIEQRYRRKDGEQIWVRNNVSLTRGADGQPRHLVVLCEDISERKRAERASARLAAIVTSAEDAIVSKTLDGIVTSWNASAERMFGYTAAEMIGQSILRIIPAGRHDEEDFILARIRAGQRIEHFETVRQTKNGRPIEVSLTISPIRDSAGTIIGASKIARDITERKRADEDLKASEAALRASQAQLTAELADMTQLQRISSQLIHEGNLDALYGQILDAAISILRADMGSMQMFYPDRNELRLLAWKGFDPAAAAFWEWVRVDSGSTCGVALQTGERVIAPDVETCEFMAGTEDLDFYRLSGIKAVQSTPLVSRVGRLVGMISTHWRAVHEPSERELHLLDVLARQAADLIERARAQEALRASEERQAFLLRLSDALRPLAGAERIQAEACRRLGEHLRVDRAYYVEVSEEEQYARVHQDYLRGDSPSLAGDLRLADYGWVVPHLRRGETVAVADTTRADIIPEADRPAMAAIKIISHISTPVIKAGSLVGALCVTESAPRTWQAADIELVRETAERIWDAIERARAEEAQRESEEKFRTLADNIPTLAWMARPDGYIFWYNQRWYTYTGTTSESQEGWGWQSVHDPDTLPHVMRQWQHSLATGVPFEMVFPLRGADGVFRPFLTRIVPVKDEHGEVVRWFGTNTDISDLRAAEEALRAANQRKDEFMGIASHELRTPLTSAKANVQIVARRLARALEASAADSGAALAKLHPLQQLLEHSEGALDRLNRLVTDLLDDSRIQAGKLELRPRRVDLTALVRDAADEEAQGWPGREVRLEGLLLAPGENADAAPEEQIWAEVDPDRVREVVGNYLSNALKYAPPGQPISVRLEAELAVGQRVARVAVRDQGPGLTPEQQAHLFERFYRVEGITHQQGSNLGLGLGLYICRTIIERHGGQVGVESAPGAGSSFWFTLPLAGSHADAGAADKGVAE